MVSKRWTARAGLAKVFDLAIERPEARGLALCDQPTAYPVYEAGRHRRRGPELYGCLCAAVPAQMRVGPDAHRAGIIGDDRCGAVGAGPVHAR